MGIKIIKASLIPGIVLIMILIHIPSTAIEPIIMPPPSPSPQRTKEPEPIMLKMKATAYCYTGNRTYTGTWPQEGRTIAVDPEVIPLGSKVYVSCESWPEINGEYIAEDTGGKIKGNIIDIYMDKYSDCIKFGKRSVIIKIQ